MGGSTRFFDSLATRGTDLLSSRVTGTVRLDLVDGPRTEHWLVEFAQCDVRVRRDHVTADCVVHTTREVFDHIVDCDDSWTAALIRGAIAIDGNVGLLAQFRKLLPGRPDARHPRSFATTEGRAQ